MLARAAILLLKAKFGHSHEPMRQKLCCRTVIILQHEATAHVHEPLYRVRRLPTQLQSSLDIAKLPLIGASPDGLLYMDAACIGSVLELKCTVPFYQDKQGSWHHADHSKAHDKVLPLQICVTVGSRNKAASADLDGCIPACKILERHKSSAVVLLVLDFSQSFPRWTPHAWAP